MRRVIVLALVAAAALPAQGGAGSSTAISFAFGRIGGNIAPFTVRIAADGSVSSAGPVRPLKSRLDPSGVARLAAVEAAQRFFALPLVIRCPNTLPDFASQFVTVRRAGAARRVLVHGDCSLRFTRLYSALAKAVGIKTA
jgi:hypothetical protein